MKDLLLFVVSILLFSMTSNGQYLSFENGTQAISSANTTPERNFENGGAQFCEIEFNFTAATISEVNAEGDLYNVLHIDGFAKMGQVGAPALPAHNEFIAMPRNSQANIVILESSYFEYSGFNIHPALKPARDTDGAPTPSFEKDLLIYTSNKFFPEGIVEVVNIAQSRGTPLAKVQQRPIQFNPVTGVIRVYTKIKYRIEFIGGEGSFDYIALENSLHYSNLLKRNIINSESIPDGINTDQTNSINGDRSVDKNYIIITHSEYLSHANDLANWKRQLGYTVEVVSQSSWTAAQVKSEIQTLYDSWTPKPDYVLILGDHTGSYAVPGEIHQSPNNNDFATDLYYSCMDGADDWHPDMARGRISVSSNYEASVIVNKIINYEKTPPSSSTFYDNVLNCAQLQDDDDNDGYADRRFCHTSEDIRDYLQDEQSYSSERVYFLSSTFDVTQLRYNNTAYSDGQLLPADLRCPSFNWAGDDNDITAGINAGKFLVFHRDHGYSGGTGWHRPYYTTSSLDALSNGSELPVVFSINCHTGEFQLNNCFAEKFLRMENKGAVGVVAASYYSYSGYNDAVAEGMIDAIWSDPGLFPDFGLGGTGSNYTIGTGNDINTMGDVVNQGLFAMEQNWNGSSPSFNYQYEIYHWFGDPAMRMWTDNPNNNIITATHNSTIDCAGNTFDISGSTPDAIATLVFNNKLIGEIVLDDSGNGTISYAITAPGTNVELTISKLNNYSYCSSVSLVGSCSFPPAVETLAATNIFSSIATVNGEITNNFGEEVTESGIVYSLNPEPVINGSGVIQLQTDPLVTNGIFSFDLTGLEITVQYYFCAYAINANGISYGDEKSFTTVCGLEDTFPYTQDMDSWTNSFPGFSCTSDGSVSLSDCWENETGDDLDWEVYSGVTGSLNTGPFTDYSGSGNYLYTESSSCYGSVGYVKSPIFDLTSLSGANLEFYYHLYGASMGSLSVQASSDGGLTWSSDIWSATGDQGNQWLQAIIPLGLYVTSDNFVFRFKAVTGISYTSDMAIDAMSIVANCDGPTQKSTSFSVTNINDNDLTVNWNRGNGSDVLVVAKQGSAVDQVPILGNTYSANAEFGMGDDLGSGNYVIYKGEGTSVTTTLLESGTNYHFAVYEYFSSENCYTSHGLIGDTTTTGEFICSLCFSNGTIASQTGTTYVGLNTIDNISEKPCGYCDYTGLCTDLEMGHNYDLSVRVNTDGDYTVYAKVWVDWNQDCDFDDAGEEFDLGTAQDQTDGPASLSPLNLLVPSDALLGNTIMRISSKCSSNPTSCETDFDGEVEDYTINVVRASSVWNGTTTNWNDASNWPRGILPDSSYQVTIPSVPENGNFPTVPVATIAQCYNLTLEEGAILIVNGTLKVEK